MKSISVLRHAVVRAGVPAMAFVLVAGCGEQNPTASEALNAPAALAVVENDAGVVVSVTGAAHFTNPETGVFRRFTIEAQVKGDGSVSGHWTVQARPDGIMAQGTVTCLWFSGNEVRWGGEVTSSDVPELLDLGWAAGRYVDNGEGANAPADQVSLTYFSAPSFVQWYCNGLIDGPPLIDVEQGNLQIIRP
jgi:hypothetical protein